jgi:hypothetical protein
LILRTSGAPEEIRTPDPQIRSLGFPADLDEYFRKPDPKAGVRDQGVSTPSANRKFCRRAAAIELRALAEAVRRIGDPTLNISGRDPHAALRLKERIAERLDRLAAEMRQ